MGLHIWIFNQRTVRNSVSILYCGLFCGFTWNNQLDFFGFIWNNQLDFCVFIWNNQLDFCGTINWIAVDLFGTINWNNSSINLQFIYSGWLGLISWRFNQRDSETTTYCTRFGNYNVLYEIRELQRNVQDSRTIIVTVCREPSVLISWRKDWEQGQNLSYKLPVRAKTSTHPCNLC